VEITVAKKPAAIRVHQLGKELGVDSKDIVAKCVAEDIPNIKDHMSVVSMGLAATIREWFSDHTARQSTAVESSAAVDLVKAKAKARKRPSKKAAGGGEDAPSSSGDTMVAVEEAEEETITTTARKSRHEAEASTDSPVTEVAATVGTQTHAKRTPAKPSRPAAPDSF
jgi:translation initiation factor IF-2